MYGKVSAGRGKQEKVRRHIPNIMEKELPQATLGSTAASLPVEVYDGGVAVEYNGQIHLMGGRSGATLNKYHHIWNGMAWEKQTDLPFKCINSGIVVYKDSIHIIGGESNLSDHWIYKNGEWEHAPNMPFTFQKGAVAVYKDCIHVMGGTGNKALHYKYDGENWENVGSLLLNFDSGCAEVLGGVIHLMGDGDTPATYGKRHYVYDGTEWTQAEDLPFSFYNGGSAKIGEYIYIFGGSGSNKAYYRYDGVTWETEGNLPYQFLNGAYCTYKGQPVIMSSSYSSTYRSYAYMLKCSEKLYQFSLQAGEVVHNNGDIEGDSSVFDSDIIDKYEKLPLPPYSGLHEALFRDGKTHWFDHEIGDSVNIYYTYENGVWTKQNDVPYYPQMKSGSIRTALLDGSIYVINVNQEFGSTYNGVCEITPNNEYKKIGWVFGTPHAGFVGYNGYLYGIGGTNVGLRSFARWNKTEGFEALGEMPSYLNMAVNNIEVYDGAIYVILANSGGHYNQLYKYNGSWTFVGQLPIPEMGMEGTRIFHSYNGKLHLYGDYKYPNNHYSFDGTSWTLEPNLDVDFNGGAAVTYDDAVHVYTNGEMNDGEAFFRLQSKIPKKPYTAIKDGTASFTAPVTVEQNGKATYMAVAEEGYFLKGQKVNGEKVTESGWRPAELPILIEGV